MGTANVNTILVDMHLNKCIKWLYGGLIMNSDWGDIVYILMESAIVFYLMCAVFKWLGIKPLFNLF